MNEPTFFDGIPFYTAADAGVISDLSRDYIARLCRENKIVGKRVGKN